MDPYLAAYNSTYSLKLMLWNYVQQNQQDFANPREVFTALCRCNDKEQIFETAQRYQIPWTPES